eukprot:3650086-Amphidinium_carterae.1
MPDSNLGHNVQGRPYHLQPSQYNIEGRTPFRSKGHQGKIMMLTVDMKSEPDPLNPHISSYAQDGDTLQLEESFL